MTFNVQIFQFPIKFYGVTSLLYLAYAIGWFFATCCNWKDLLRVQFWIGGVIALGSNYIYFLNVSFKQL